MKSTRIIRLCLLIIPFWSCLLDQAFSETEEISAEKRAIFLVDDKNENILKNPGVELLLPPDVEVSRYIYMLIAVKIEDKARENFDLTPVIQKAFKELYGKNLKKLVEDNGIADAAGHVFIPSPSSENDKVILHLPMGFDSIKAVTHLPRNKTIVAILEPSNVPNNEYGDIFDVVGINSETGIVLWKFRIKADFPENDCLTWVNDDTVLCTSSGRKWTHCVVFDTKKRKIALEEGFGVDDPSYGEYKIRDGKVFKIMWDEKKDAEKLNLLFDPKTKLP